MLVIMGINSNLLLLLSKRPFQHVSNQMRWYHGTTFFDFYQKTTGNPVSETMLPKLKRRHAAVFSLTEDNLKCSLQILQKFNITPIDACQDVHVFCMNPITMDNYAEILKECGFVNIRANHIIRYHTLVKSRTIRQLKKEGLMRDDTKLEERLLQCYQDLPDKFKVSNNFPDSNTPILTVRMSVLERFLNWQLSVTPEEFNRYCRLYLPLKHKPMADIKEAVYLARNIINMNDNEIRRNGFVISADPIKTKLILENIQFIAGLDIKEVIRIEPAILKNKYTALLEIIHLMEEYRISDEALRRNLKVFCMKPETVRERLEELSSMKEFQVLSSNPRVLSMVVHKKKMMNRLNKIQTAKKQCYSLNLLVSSSKIFNNFMGNFGSKVCSRDIAILVASSLNLDSDLTNTQIHKSICNQLKRHKYWLHTALNIISQNVQFLKKRFSDDVIYKNCHLLLYPMAEIEQYMDHLLKLRDNKIMNVQHDATLDLCFNNLNFNALTDEQILSLVLYQIEKKYHFTCDGVWARQDGGKFEVQNFS